MRLSIKVAPYVFPGYQTFLLVGRKSSSNRYYFMLHYFVAQIFAHRFSEIKKKRKNSSKMCSSKFGVSRGNDFFFGICIQTLIVGTPKLHRPRIWD